MIFKTFDSDSDKFISKIGILNRSFEQWGEAIRARKLSVQEKSKDLSLFDNFDATATLQSLRDVESQLPNNKDAWTKYFSTLDDGSKWQVKFVQDNDLSKVSLEQVENAQKAARESAIAYNNSLEQMTFGAKAANVAMKGLAIAGNMIIYALISKGIEIAVTAIDNYIHRVERAQEAIEEITSDIAKMNDELKSASKTVKDSAKRFAELAQGVNQLTGENISLNTEDYEEFLDLNNQLAELFPSLPRIFDENGNAIVQLSGDVDTIVGSLKNLVDVQRQITNQEIADKLPDLYANTKTVADDYESQLKELNGDYEYYQGLVSKLNEFNYDTLKNIGTSTDESLLTAYNQVLARLGIATGAKGGFDDYGNHVVKNLTPAFVMGDDYLASLEDVKDQIPKVVNELLEEYNTEVNHLSDDINITNEKNKANWSSLAGSIAAWLTTDSSYKIMSDDMQATIQNIVNSLDWGDLDFSSWEDAQQYIQDNILSLFQTQEGKDVLDDIEVMFGIQTQFNNGKVTVDEYQEKLNAFLTVIKDLPEESQKAIKLLFGIKTDENGETSSDVDTMINNVKEKFGEEFNVGKLQLSELETLSNTDQATIDKYVAEETAKTANIVQAYRNAADRIIEDFRKANPDKTIFSDVWNLLAKDTKEKLLELAKSGEITEKVLESTEEYDELLDKTGLIAEQVRGKILDMLTATEKLAAASQGGSKPLTSAYEEYLKKGFVVADTLESIPDTFKELKSWDLFKQIAGDPNSGKEAIQKMFDQILTEWYAKQEILKGITEENKGMYVANLDDQNIANSEEVVDEYLKDQELLDKANEEYYKALVDGGKTYLEYVNEKGEIDKEYFSQFGENTVTVFTQLGEAYQDDLANWCNLMKAKADAYNDLNKTINSYHGVNGYTYDTEKSIVGNILAAGLTPTSSNIALFEELSTKYQLASIEANKAREELNQDLALTQANFSLDFDKITSGSGSGSGSSNEYNWIEVLISRIERGITNLGKTISATYKTWSTRISAIKKETSELTKELSVQKQAANYYLNKANSVGLNSTLAARVRNGEIRIEEITNEDTQNKISKYQEYYEKYLEALDSQKDIEAEIAQNYADTFDMIASEYDAKIGTIESQSGILDSLISKQETDGHLVSKAYYQSLKNLQNQNIAELQSKRTDLMKAFNEAMANGNIKQYSEDWYDMKNSIMEVDKALVEANTQLIELDNNMRDLDWKVFDLKQQYIGRIQEEADYLTDLMSNEDLYNDYGKMNDFGISTAGLHATNYDVYLKQAQQYASEIKKVDKLLADDPYDTELIDRRNELIDSHRDMVKAAQDEQQAIIDMVEEGYNRMLDALNKIIEKKKEDMQATKDLYDYERSIAEKTKNISSLQKQLSAYEGDNSEETQAKIQQIKVDLEEAKQDLQDAEYDKWMSDQEQMLDKLSSDTQEWIEARMDNVEAIMQDIITQTNENAKLIKDTLVEQTGNLGSFISEEMNKIFSGGSPVSSFMELFTNEDAGVLKVVNGIASNVQTMVNQLTKQAKSDIASKGTTASSNKKSSTTQKSTSKTTSSTPSTTKKITRNTSSSNGNKDYRFIYAKSYYPKDKLNRKTSIDDALAYYDYDWSFNAKKKYYKDLIGNDAYTGSYNQNVALLKKFRGIKGYSQGGVIGELKNVIGKNNDNSLAINTFEKGEGIIPLPLMGDWKILINNLEPLNASMDFLNKVLIPNIKANRSTNETVNNDVQMSITLPNVTNYDEFKNALVKDKSFEKVVQSMTLGNALGKNSLSKNKY